VIPFEYEIVYDFRENITGVFANNKWLLINKNNTIVKQPAISVFYGFVNGKAKIISNGRIGFMNTAGEITYTGEMEQPVAARIPLSNTSSAVTQCPDNIDFENGNFNNWNCFTGYVDSVGNTNVITVTPSAPVANRHRIYNRVIPS